MLDSPKKENPIGQLNIPKEKKPKRKKTQSTIHIYDDVKKRAKIHLISEDKGQDLSSLINQLLEKWCDKQDKKSN
mgnify:CR=1 FL=1